MRSRQIIEAVGILPSALYCFQQKGVVKTVVNMKWIMMFVAFGLVSSQSKYYSVIK